MNNIKSLRPYQEKSVNETWKALKKNDEPVLFNMSVGGGKSICISNILKTLEDQNKNALCLVNSAELVRNNSSEYEEYGGVASVFCASMRKKEWSSNIIFATPQSIFSAIKSNHKISHIKFNMIVIDEAHGISYKEQNSTFMKILTHYKQLYKPMRILGLTGTPYRLNNGKSESIVGNSALFKTSVANIDTKWLVDNNYLVPPVFGKKYVDDMDMKSLCVDKNGNFKLESLNAVVDDNKRLTWEILQEVQKIMANRNGAFIFCSTIAHCHEAMRALPAQEAEIIIGETSNEKRNQILNDARAGKIKYLISVSCLLVGVNVPFFDTSVFLRPTQSLTLFVQAVGRCLRLHPTKKDGLILDYAANLDRFSDFDNPIINESLLARDKHEEEEKPFICYTCNTPAGIHTRRCHGMVHGQRCQHYFQFKACPRCFVQNDITARHCRNEQCRQELVDPNKKLKRIVKEKYTLNVQTASYWVSVHPNTFMPIVYAKYICGNETVFESFYLKSEQSKNIFWSNFMKNHIDSPSKYYTSLNSYAKIKNMLNNEKIKTPYQIVCTKNIHDKYVVNKKIF